MGSGRNLPSLRQGEAFFISLAADSCSVRPPPDVKRRVISRSLRKHGCSLRTIALHPSTRFRRRCAGENWIPFHFAEHEPGATAGSQPFQGREVWRDLGTPRPRSRIEKMGFTDRAPSSRLKTRSELALKAFFD